MIIALITFDLTEATPTEREQFYQTLRQKRWLQLNNLTTAWKCRKQKAGRNSAILEIEQDLKYAKAVSLVSRVDYALQINAEDMKQSFV